MVPTLDGSTMKSSRCRQLTASEYEVCPETSISVLQQSRRHSSFLISPSVHSEFHIGVVSQPGTCDLASGHWEPSESVSQEHFEPLVVVSTANCCCCAVGDGIDIELVKLWDAEKYCSELASTAGTALRVNVEATGSLASRCAIPSKRIMESRMSSAECIRDI